jgi:hypothetical protein
MERYFYRRGQRVQVSELEGVLAVQVDPAASANVTAGAFGDPVEVPSAAAVPADAPSEELQALSAAGWVFVRPTRSMAELAHPQRICRRMCRRSGRYTSSRMVTC